MKLLANENFPRDSVIWLRNAGCGIISIGEDNPSISDKDVTAIAESEQRLILTFDRDYGELIYKFNYKPEMGVIYLRLEKYESNEPGKIVHELR